MPNSVANQRVPTVPAPILPKVESPLSARYSNYRTSCLCHARCLTTIRLSVVIFHSLSTIAEVTEQMVLLAPNGCRATSENSRRYPRRTPCKEHAIRMRRCRYVVQCPERVRKRQPLNALASSLDLRIEVTASGRFILVLARIVKKPLNQSFQSCSAPS